MNAIESVGNARPVPALQGQAVVKQTLRVPPQTPVMGDSGKVIDSLTKNFEEVKESVRQLQKVADAVGTKVLFKVNKQLGRVVVSVVDPKTEQVIKEIPSAEVQQMQIRIRETIGLLFDKQI